jgi:hypothetical protein
MKGLVFLHKSSMYLEVHNLRDNQSSTPISDAMVTAVIKDSNGADVGGETWPVTLTALPRSPGFYRVVIPPSLAVVPGQKYVAQITVIKDDLERYWEADVLVRIDKT